MPFIPQDTPAVQGNDVTVFAKNRCSRSASWEQRRGRPRLGLKKTGSLAAPRFFLFPYAAVYVEDIDDGAHRKSGV
jgi:hypothetical protein